MPIYDYKCSICERFFEVFHSMSECDSPSEKTLSQITCPKDHYECQPTIDEISEHTILSEEDFKFKRVFNVPNIKGSYGGSSLSGKEKLATIQKERKGRSHDHFKKEIFPTLPKQEKKHFERKWKKEGR